MHMQINTCAYLISMHGIKSCVTLAKMAKVSIDAFSSSFHVSSRIVPLA